MIQALWDPRLDAALDQQAKQCSEKVTRPQWGSDTCTSVSGEEVGSVDRTMMVVVVLASESITMIAGCTESRHTSESGSASA